ncbi:MAG: phage tail tape measure protein [Clostridiales bacterium]
MSIIVGEVVAPIRGDTRPFQRSINDTRSMGETAFTRLGAGMKNFGGVLKNVGATLTKSITLPLVGAGIAVFKLGKDFESEMSKVVGLVGVAKDQVDLWGKEIISIAPELGKAPKELAEAMFFVTSAGLRGAAAMDVLTTSAKASTAGLGETKTIADLVTSAINAYGQKNLSASKATDILVAAVREGKAEASELAASMGQVLPLASELGVTFDQVAATQAAMTRTGTNASEAATQLKSIMAGLIKPSKQAEEQLDAMGTSSAKMRKAIREDGLLSALMELREMTNKYGEEAMARVFPNIRALMGVLDLMGSNLEGNIKTFEAVKNSTGSLDKAFEAASETLDFKWNAAIAKVQSVLIGFFDIVKSAMIPVLEMFIKVLDFVSKKFEGLSANVKTSMVVIAGLLGVVGPVIGAVGIAITTLGGIIAVVATIITTLTTVISTVGLPVLGALAIAAVVAAAEFAVLAAGITAAIGLVVGSFYYLWNTNTEFRDKVVETWESVKKSALEIFDEIRKIVMIAFNHIKSFWEAHGNSVISIMEKIFKIILFMAENGMKELVGIFKIMTSIIEGDWGKAWERYKNLVSKNLDKIISIVSPKLDEIIEIFRTKFDEIKTYIMTKFDEIKTYITNIFDEIKTAIDTKIDEINTAIIDAFKTMPEKIEKQLKKWEEAIINSFESMPEKITERLEKWGEAMETWATEQNEENIRQFSLWWESIKEWFGSIPAKITKSLEEWWESIKEWFDDTKESISTKLEGWWETIKNWFDSLPEKFEKSLNNVWETIKKSFDTAKKAIETKLEEWWKTIKDWFINLSEKKEIKNAGKKMIDKVSKGNEEKKQEFIDKLGKIIVDVAIGAVIFASVALIAAGREIIKRVLTGVKQIDLKGAGRNIVQGLINGIKEKLSQLKKVANDMASIVRNRLPFSPAKEGPLRDLDKIDFARPIASSLERAKSIIEMPMDEIGNSIMQGLTSNNLDLGGSNSSNKGNINFYGDFSFEGIKDIPGFMAEMRSTILRHGGRNPF